MHASPVLVHYHIFKNAGTSIDECLRHSFGESWGAFEGPDAHAIQSSEQLAAHLQANPRLAAVSSHLARPPVPTPNCLPIAFIRHPLIRAYSVYQFTRRCPSQPFSDVAQATGFDGYIRWALREEPGSIVIRDYQVVHLSDASWRCDHILKARALPEDMAQACALISSWGVVGVVELFDLSIRTYQALYGPWVPSLALDPRTENSTTPGPAPIDERVNALRELLGEDLHAQFMAVNQLDLALHTHAIRVLQQAARCIDLTRSH